MGRDGEEGREGGREGGMGRDGGREENMVKDGEGGREGREHGEGWGGREGGEHGEGRVRGTAGGETANVDCAPATCFSALSAHTLAWVSPVGLSRQQI